MFGARLTGLVVAFGSWAAAASADPPAPAGQLLPVFTIAKSENKNQVQYVVRVDSHCVPLGPRPMSAYWRMLERGPNQTAPILDREIPAYGMASQEILTREAESGKVRTVLNALRSRPVTVVTSRATDGACHAVAIATITSQPAHLFNVYARLKWDGVAYLLLRGWSMDGTHVVSEKVDN